MLSELLSRMRLWSWFVFFIFILRHSWIAQYSLKKSLSLFIFFVFDIAEWILYIFLLVLAFWWLEKFMVGHQHEGLYPGKCPTSRLLHGAFSFLEDALLRFSDMIDNLGHNVRSLVAPGHTWEPRYTWAPRWSDERDRLRHVKNAAMLIKLFFIQRLDRDAPMLMRLAHWVNWVC